MDLDTLRFGNFSKLATAVTDWDEMVAKLKTLADDANRDLKGKADKANWSGMNAAVSRGFIDKTAGEFDDAHTQAGTVRNILKDTHDELVGYQKQLNAAIDGGLKKNLTVMDLGGGKFTVTMNVHPDRAGQGVSLPEHTVQDENNLRDEVQRILTAATQSDTTAAETLSMIVDQAPYGFSDANYKDRDSAADAVQKAKDMAKLMKDPQHLTPEQFDELNRTLKKYQGDDLFSEELATQMGPRGTVDFWAHACDATENPELARARKDQMGELQKNLSLTLANATQSDSPAMQNWERDMVALGDDKLRTRTTTPYGFQVMSNLMRFGDFDDKFLTDYGSQLMKTEKAHSANGRRADIAWNSPTNGYLNRTGTDQGDDPLVGYLKGLSNSPDAATEFLNQPFVGKDDPDNPFERDPDGDGPAGKSKVGLSNFQYLFEERKWPPEIDDHMKESHVGKDFLGDAILAGTTGHLPDEQPGPDTLPHNPEQAKLMQSVVHSIGENGHRLTDNKYMSDSMGQMAAEYLPDINRAISAPGDDGGQNNVNRLFPVAGTAANLSLTDTTRFLVDVGQDPTGYAKVETGQKAYMASLMDYQLNPDVPADQRYPGSPEETIKAIAHNSGTVSGTLAVGRQEAVLGPAHKADADFDSQMASMKSGVSGLVSTGVGIGTTFIASPVAGAVTSGVSSTITGAVLDKLFDQHSHHAADSAYSASAMWEQSRRETNSLTEQAANQAAQAHHVPGTDQSQAGDWANQGVRDGYAEASSNVRRMGDDLDTELPPS